MKYLTAYGRVTPFVLNGRQRTIMSVWPAWRSSVDTRVHKEQSKRFRQLYAFVGARGPRMYAASCAQCPEWFGE